MSEIFWTATSADAFNQIATEQYGNGVASTISHNLPNGQPEPMGRITGISNSVQDLSYTWDALGNLTSRTNNLAGGASETFQYDLLNRLTSAQVGGQPAVSYSYDALGDITSKSDMGNYTYAGTGPHAVSSVTGNQPGTYAYDPNGNMNNRNGTAITWNSLNMPTCIDAGGGSCTSGSNWSQFSYAPDKHRTYQSAMIFGVAETTVYSGPFEARTSAGTTTYRHHLMADGREVAEVDLTDTGGTITEGNKFILTDHLGSVDVVTDINGNPIVDMSFGAFGNRREPTTWLPPVTQAEAQLDHQKDRYGFTHQEMLDNVALIHMNGRVYDPSLGRFLSVDPVFEFPTNTQSLNPYSYVLNNPLSMTDPTGYAAAACPNGSSTACPDELKTGDTAHISYTPTGSHIAVTATAMVQSDGSVKVTSNSPQAAQAIAKNASAMFGNGGSSSQGAASAQTKPTDAASIGSPQNVSKNDVVGTPQMDKQALALSKGWKNTNPVEQGVMQTDKGTQQLTQCDNAECNVTDSSGHLLYSGKAIFMLHSHVLSNTNDPIGKLKNDFSRVLPGPGDGNVVAALRVPNYTKGEDGVLRVVEIRGGQFSVRTVTPGVPDAPGLSTWKAGVNPPLSSMQQTAIHRYQNHIIDFNRALKLGGIPPP